MLSRSYASSYPRAPVVVLVSQSAAHISLRKQFVRRPCISNERPLVVLGIQAVQVQ